MEQETIHNKIIFIGGGNLAEAIFSKLNLDKYKIEVIQHNKEKLLRLKILYPHITFYHQLDYEPKANDLVFLAVKPQDAKSVCMGLHTKLQKASIISVMAGITTTNLAKWLDNHKIARIMPNVLVAVGYGVSGLFFSESIIPKYKNIIIDIFNSVGKTYLFDIEDDINKITATAASAPAYIFYFLECMINSTIALGMDKATAKEIVLQIAAGSIELIKQNTALSIEDLRGRITSKNGTTEAAIKVLEQASLNQIVDAAEAACYIRSQELSNLD
ncbi:MAG: pyrroline-5-carboxylate reductase [Proteobacteria bacterium]|nr:pyrroline-5-carboxylate reductase [Pseudomonadota bacterium]